MSKKLMTISGVVLGAAVLFAAPNGFAFTSGSGDGPGAGGSSADEPSSPSGAATYDFSDPNFDFSVRTNDSAPNAAVAPQRGSAHPPIPDKPGQSRGFFDRVWGRLLDVIGVGD